MLYTVRWSELIWPKKLGQNEWVKFATGQGSNQPYKKGLFFSPIFGVKSTQLQGSNWTMWRVNLESVSATLEFEVAKTAPKISALLQMTP